jgi:hypothetical protein
MARPPVVSITPGAAWPKATRSPSKHRPRLAVPEGLDLLGSTDTVAGRHRFIERLDGFIREEQSDPLAGDVPLSKQFELIWFWGSELFRERLVARIEKMGQRKSRNYRCRREGPARDHGRRKAEEIDPHRGREAFRTPRSVERGAQLLHNDLQTNWETA